MVAIIRFFMPVHGFPISTVLVTLMAVHVFDMTVSMAIRWRGMYLSVLPLMAPCGSKPDDC